MNELEEISIKIPLILPDKLDAFTSELLYGVVVYSQDGEVIDPTKICLDDYNVAEESISLEEVSKYLNKFKDEGLE